MKDDIETLREFIRGITGPSENGQVLAARALATLKRLEKEREPWRTMLAQAESDCDSLRAKFEKAMGIVKHAHDFGCMSFCWATNSEEQKEFKKQQAESWEDFCKQGGFSELSADAPAPRDCTCHPSEAPDPCQHKYAFSECVKAAQPPQISDEALWRAARAVFLEVNSIMEMCDEKWRAEKIVRGQRWFDIARAIAAALNSNQKLPSPPTKS